MSKSSFLQREFRARKIEARVRVEKQSIDQAQQGASSLVGTVYAVMLVSLLLLVIGVMSTVRPKLLPWNKPAIPRQALGMLYPAHISPEKDLVPVVSKYVICTPDNLQARNAVRYVLQQREALKSRAIKVSLYPKEHHQVQTFASTTTICGDNFEEKFLESPRFLENDMFLWCLLRESRVQGIAEYGIDFHRPLRAFQNLAVRDAANPRRILSSLLISASDSIVPSKMFDWLLSARADDWNESEYRNRMEYRLFELISQDNEQGKWTFFDAVCGEDHKNFATRKKLATVCQPNREECCHIYEQPLSSGKAGSADNI